MNGVEGSALLALEQIRDNTAHVRTTLADLRAQGDLADLKLVTTLCGLPEPRWNVCPEFGAVGVVDGNAKAVEYAVEQWAQAFTTWVTGERPDVFSKTAVAGWAVMHATVRGLRFTVGGRLDKAGSR